MVNRWVTRSSRRRSGGLSAPRLPAATVSVLAESRHWVPSKRSSDAMRQYERVLDSTVNSSVVVVSTRRVRRSTRGLVSMRALLASPLLRQSTSGGSSTPGRCGATSVPRARAMTASRAPAASIERPARARPVLTQPSERSRSITRWASRKAITVAIISTADAVR